MENLELIVLIFFIIFNTKSIFTTIYDIVLLKKYYDIYKLIIINLDEVIDVWDDRIGDDIVSFFNALENATIKDEVKNEMIDTIRSMVYKKYQVTL